MSPKQLAIKLMVLPKELCRDVVLLAECVDLGTLMFIIAVVGGGLGSKFGANRINRTNANVIYGILFRVSRYNTNHSTTPKPLFIHSIESVTMEPHDFLLSFSH